MPEHIHGWLVYRWAGPSCQQTNTLKTCNNTRACLPLSPNPHTFLLPSWCAGMIDPARTPEPLSHSHVGLSAAASRGACVAGAGVVVAVVAAAAIHLWRQCCHVGQAAVHLIEVKPVPDHKLIGALGGRRGGKAGGAGQGDGQGAGSAQRGMRAATTMRRPRRPATKCARLPAHAPLSLIFPGCRLIALALPRLLSPSPPSQHSRGSTPPGAAPFCPAARPP